MVNSGKNSRSRNSSRKKSIGNQQLNQARTSISEMLLEAINHLKNSDVTPEEIRKYVLNQHNVDIRDHPMDINLVTRLSGKDYVKVYPTFQMNIKRIRSIKQPLKGKSLKQDTLKSKKKICKTSPKYYFLPQTRSNSVHLETQPSQPRSSKTNLLKENSNSGRNNSLNFDRKSVYAELEKPKSNHLRSEIQAVEPNPEASRRLSKKKSSAANFASKEGLQKNAPCLSRKRKQVSPGAIAKKKMTARRNSRYSYFESKVLKAGDAIKGFIRDLSTKCSTKYTDLCKIYSATSIELLNENHPFDTASEQSVHNVSREDNTNENTTRSERIENERIQETPGKSTVTTEEGIRNMSAENSLLKEDQVDRCNDSQRAIDCPRKCSKTSVSNKNLKTEVAKKKSTIKKNVVPLSIQTRSEARGKRQVKQKLPTKTNERKQPAKTRKCTVKTAKVGLRTSSSSKSIRNDGGIKSRKNKGVTEARIKNDVKNVLSKKKGERQVGTKLKTKKNPVAKISRNARTEGKKKTEKKRAVKETRRILPKSKKKG